ncbi:integrase [Xylanibacillus composti]|uniref:Site-specific recombinase XerD n=1 Tax=Xylanibacillus composti TaxID=1572762 RepID=A0A8J4M2T5_9BACL|nr:tyrosine-type recombinase/integrase [Xylanibacillus composti]MDT9725204.1 integrase [Xylanibacillus composti]GIQ70054.1 hypothetical protein XYCOK13_28780 [Xylanibacillus composti]
MNAAIVKSINPKTDKWVLSKKSSLGDTMTFDFTYLPNRWFKRTLKEITIDCFTLGKPSFETLNRYNYSLKHFFNFYNEVGLNLKTFEELTHQHTQMFVFYLQNQKMSNATRNVIMAALKWFVEYGRFFEYDGFPTRQVFDGEEYKALQTEDILKTRYIPDTVMRQIEIALSNEKNVILKSLIEIGIDTGIRLSEALELEEGCISEDFTGKPVLYVRSEKNKSERFIPVSNRVKTAVKTLETYTAEARKTINSRLLVTYWMPNAKRFDRLIQREFRSWLKIFVKKHKIKDVDGEVYPLVFHAFRHTLGTDMLNKGMTIFEIQDYLGHDSLHSTAGYAKVQNPKIQREYKKLGFVGVITKEINKESLGNGRYDTKTLKASALPDGVCRKPINNEGKVCAKFNLCIICPKFITTPQHLSIHKQHLERLRADKEAYMASEFIGTVNHLETIEYALETIIERLEAL